MRILLVEDEKKTASFIGKALQEEGFGPFVLLLLL
jgi:DNA-binding response OmpR family regulator